MSKAVESKEFWEQQLVKLKTSGLSRSKYCRENGIDYDKFGYWLKRLSSAPSRFVPVELQAPEAATPHAILCTIELRGHVLKIHDISALSFLLTRLT